MKKIVKLVAVYSSILFFASCSYNETKLEQLETKEELLKRVFLHAEAQYDFLISQIDTVTPLLQPRSINKDGSYRLAYKEDWTSGFFPGSLWYLYENSKNDIWKNRAEKYTMALDSAQFVKWNHDVGFMIQNSFGQGFRLTGNELYKQAVVDAANSLSTRFRPKAKIIQSWDTDAPWIQGKGLDMPVIIDNMMNLNLLYEATKITSDSTYAYIANSHASTTIRNQYREDFSCFHIVDYDHISGEVRKKVNFQGYSNESSWARGQAWGLYGYTEAYGETKNKKYLDQAVKIAQFIIKNDRIVSDKIPYWDYDDPSIPETPRDASAAAIVASAMLELQIYDTTNKEQYVTYAKSVLRTLSNEEYLAKIGENGGFLLKHSVGNIHEDNETDAPLNYADYYFLEALMRWKSLSK